MLRRNARLESRREVLRQLSAATALLALPALAGAGQKITPRPATDFTLTVEGKPGQTQSLSALRGQVVMLNFWATWCGPCRQEMPLLDAMAHEFAPRGFTLLGVNVEAADAKLKPFLKKVKLGFPILRDFDNKVAHAYNVQAMPTTLLIDRRGQWRWQHRAYLPGDEAQYLEMVRALLAEAP